MSYKPFIDSSALIGRPKLYSKDITELPARPFSRSLDKIITLLPKTLMIEIRDDNYLIINVNHILGDKVKINKKDAIKLANWILTVYTRRTQSNGTHRKASSKTQMARQDKGSR